MIRQFTLGFLILLFSYGWQLSTSHAGLTSADPKRIAALYNKIYVADGYDTNDHVQITGEGMFRSTCYRHAETTVHVDEAKQVISLGPVAYEYSGYCLQFILPFQRIVDVGILKPGKWSIHQGGGQVLGSFTVKPATSNSADDFIYAPVALATLEQNGATSEVIISGAFSTDCMELDREILTIQNEVIVIQPIAKVITGSMCKDGAFPFSKKVSISAAPPGRYLLHVRTLGGNALNSMIDKK